MINKFLVILTLVSVVGSEIKAEKYVDVHDVYKRCYPVWPWNTYGGVCGPAFTEFKNDINKLDESGFTVLDRSRQDARRFRGSVQGAVARAAVEIITELGGKSRYDLRAEIVLKGIRERINERAKIAAQREFHSSYAEHEAKIKPNARKDGLERSLEIPTPAKTENAPQALARSLQIPTPAKTENAPQAYVKVLAPATGSVDKVDKD